MNDDLVVFIFSHGRPDNVRTIKTLEKHGFTGKVFVVIDDEDKAAYRYYELFGDKVIMFDKVEAAKLFDVGDNFTDRRAIVYARNASYAIAEKLGYKYFLQLEDDYVDFRYKINSDGISIDKKNINNLDVVVNALLDYYKSIPAKCIAIQQGGDFLGGKNGNAAKNPQFRKVMNSLLCSTERVVKWVGRMNDDVNTYVEAGRRGSLFLSIPLLALQQPVTQKVFGGHSDIYKSVGTYVKSFYSVMYAPSCVSVAMMNSRHSRIHHQVSYNNAVPCIISKQWKK